MKKHLLPRILMGYVITALAGFILVANFSNGYFERHLKENTASQMQNEASLIAESYAEGNFSSQLTLNEFQEHLAAVSTYLGGDIFVISTEGEILVESGDMTSLLNPEVIDGFDILDFSGGNYTMSRFYGTYNEAALIVYAAVASSYRTDCYVFVCLPSSTIDDLQNDLLNGAYLTLFFLLLIAFVILLIYIFSIHLPLRRLVCAARHYNSGDFTYSPNVHTETELGTLAASFEYMKTELATLEDDQRKFVSNVSHDFRSPLTSIKGYAEAMADGTIPPELQDKYLNVIIYETERLEKLTQELLDLNKYGSNGFYLDVSTFDLNACIRRTVETFEQTARQKQISFKLILTGSELYVRADMSRIQQVLQNLIDNAVKFSSSNSSIDIETTVKNEKVFVSVKDYGIGIPKESQGKIWERFYKTDISRGRDKKGTGLGLAIVKEIITAHNENINVISTVNVGTEFIFTLPLGTKPEE